MPDVIRVEYGQTGASTAVDAMGMREMQRRAFAARDSQYLLLKAPPASGKSRALMYIALDKLFKQGVRKAIVAVPERAIAKSFAPIRLTESGFFADWEVAGEDNLCGPSSENAKVEAVGKFLEGSSPTLICTHQTLRFAHDSVDPGLWDNTLVAVDEFHHVSASEESRLGELVRSLMRTSSAHLVAMTGSYFRGDGIPVLEPEDEQRFTKITYNYYDQLEGYTHLKSLGIGYHFYQGSYLTAIDEVLDTDLKTIVHIPNVQSGESTQDKYNEVGEILDRIGEFVGTDPETGLITVRRADGRELLIADLVNDDPAARGRTVEYLRKMSDADDLDIIIALGMAKEGFDWPYCEHALTIGYRGSLTEVVQIIGRCTRDSPNKTHAQFTNLVAQPAADDDQVKVAVNNMLKAITASLLMEQVMAPSFKFKTRRTPGEQAGPGELKIGGLKEPSTERVREVIENGLDDLKATLFQDPAMQKAMPGNVDPEVMNKVIIPKVIQARFPDLSTEEVEELRQHVVVDSAVKNGRIKEVGDRRFVLLASKFVRIEDLHIDLIDTVNPFQHAFEVLSKSVTTHVLKVLQDEIATLRLDMSDEEALLLWPKAQAFTRENGRSPKLNAGDPLEHRMAEAVLYIKRQAREQGLTKSG